MPKFFALRPHQGDKWYNPGDPRELPAKVAERLVANGVLGTEPPEKKKAGKPKPARKTKPASKTKPAKKPAVKKPAAKKVG